jgi:sterol desaturase/sphingolipid hydroxylase (fatty acid hydroxylase superfamily)
VCVRVCAHVCVCVCRVHDVHHRNIFCNYGQYIMLWDRLFGTYVPYENSIRGKMA